MEGKHGLQVESTFDFKYIPDLHKTTRMEDGERTGIQQSGIERRNLQAFTIGCGFMVAIGFASLKIAGELARKIMNA